MSVAFVRKRFRMILFLYIEVGGVVLQVLCRWYLASSARITTHKSWRRVQVVSIEPLVIGPNSALTELQIVSYINSWRGGKPQLRDNLESAPQQQNLPNWSAQLQRFFYCLVFAPYHGNTRRRGFDTGPTEYEEEEFNQTMANLDALLAQRNTTDILDGGDGYENQFWSTRCHDYGTAAERRRRTVVLTITDVNGNTVTTSAITNDEAWRQAWRRRSSLPRKREFQGRRDRLLMTSKQYHANDSTIKTPAATITSIWWLATSFITNRSATEC